MPQEILQARAHHHDHLFMLSCHGSIDQRGASLEMPTSAGGLFKYDQNENVEEQKDHEYEHISKCVFHEIEDI